MTWSVTEIATLATKAARGGGAPPEQAMRFGQAVAIHLQKNRATAALMTVLDALPEGPILNFPLAIDQALAATEDADRYVDAPDGELLTSYIETLPFETHLVVSENGGLLLKLSHDAPRAKGGAKRIEGCAALIEKMTEMAEKTLVPESESSRLSGAGAGLTDND